MENKKKISKFNESKLSNLEQLRLTGGSSSGIGGQGINQNPVLAAQLLPD